MKRREKLYCNISPRSESKRVVGVGTSFGVFLGEIRCLLKARVLYYLVDFIRREKRGREENKKERLMEKQ